MRIMAPWELEQLASLLLFFVERLANYFLLIQRQLVTDVLDQAGRNEHADASEVVKLSSLEHTDLFDFSSDWPYMLYHDFCGMASRGLGFLGEMTNPRTSAERRFTLFRKTPEWHSKSLDRALETTRRMRDSASMRELLDGMEDWGSESPNEFFSQYIHTDTWQEASIMNPKRFGLRATGCVFWDQSRLDSMGAHGALWRTTTRNYADCKRLRPLQGRTAEEIISGLSIPADSWKVLTEKYKSRYGEAPEPNDSEENDDLPSDYALQWSRDHGWWGAEAEDHTPTGGGWFDLFETTDSDDEYTAW
jgi:hypothetical protein